MDQFNSAPTKVVECLDTCINLATKKDKFKNDVELLKVIREMVGLSDKFQAIEGGWFFKLSEELKELEMFHLPFPTIFVNYKNFRGEEIGILCTEDGIDIVKEQGRVHVIVFVKTKGEKDFQINPILLTLEKKDAVRMLDGELKVQMGYSILFRDIMVSKDIDFDKVAKKVFGEFLVVLQLCCVLDCQNVEVVKHSVPLKLNKKRASKGRVPFYEFKIVEIKQTKCVVEEHDVIHSDRESPRYHARRGHIRHLGTGKNVWVKPCWVGSPELGMIGKDYKLVKKSI